MTAYLGPFPIFRAFTADGEPAVGYYLWTYETGTDTAQDTFDDAGGLSANTNPIVLDANGEARVYFANAAYRLVLEDDTGDINIPGQEHGVQQWLVDDYAPVLTTVSLAGYSTTAATQAIIQGQTCTAYASTGSAPTFLLTPSPVITAYATGQEWEVTFNATGTTGSNTLNVNSLGAKNLKQYDSTGTKVAGVVVSAQVAKVRYDGTDFVILNPLPNGSQVRGTARGILGVSTGANPNYVVTIDEASVTDSVTGRSITLSAVSKTLAMTSTGAGGLDGGILAASTLYYVWLIYNGTDTALMASLSATDPTMPAGYTFKAMIGTLVTDASNKYPLAQQQRGKSIQYRSAVGNVTVLPAIASGAGTNSAVSMAAFVPWAMCSQVRLTARTAAQALNIRANATATDFLWSTDDAVTTQTATVSIVPEAATVVYSGGTSAIISVLGYTLYV